MKKSLLLMMVIAMVAMSASATKIYVCGTKITGTTSFSAGGGTVAYDAGSNTLLINNVNYTKTGGSNNGISIDEVSSSLYIYMIGTVKFDIGDADAVLCKDANKHATYINISGDATFLSKSSSHAGLKLQDCNVEIKGSGTLTIQNTSSSSSACAIKGGTGNENLDFKINKCTISSNGIRLYKLNNVSFSGSGYYDSGDFSDRSTLITIKHGSSNTVHAKDVSTFWSDVNLFTPIEYYLESVQYLTSTTLANKDVEISDYTPAVIITPDKFPDANLYNYLRYLEPQGWLTTSAMYAYTYMNISGKNISNLAGLWQYANLKELRCNNNNLTNLYGLPTSIQTLDCSSNKITSFNYLLNCSSLKSLNCSNNQISSSNDLPYNIEYLDCSSNKFSGSFSLTGRSNLKTLDISNNPNIVYLKCNDNSLTSLSVNGCTNLNKLECNNNQLTSLDVSSLSNLISLLCFSNKLTSLNVANKTKLRTIQAHINQLTSINVNGCTALQDLLCAENKLSSLSVQGCYSLRLLNCFGNQIKESAMNTLVNSLCTIPVGSTGDLDVIYPGLSGGYTEGNVITDAQVQAARNKRWLPKKWDGGNWLEILVSIPGDVNGDGTVTAADITALYDVLLNNDYSQIVNGDQTGDGVITAADVTAVYTIMLSSKE